MNVCFWHVCEFTSHPEGGSIDLHSLHSGDLKAQSPKWWKKVSEKCSLRYSRIRAVFFFLSPLPPSAQMHSIVLRRQHSLCASINITCLHRAGVTRPTSSLTHSWLNLSLKSRDFLLFLFYFAASGQCELSGTFFINFYTSVWAAGGGDPR